MPLKLGPISEQVNRMAQLAADAEHRDRLEEARKLLRTVDAEELRAKLSAWRIRIPWLAATPVDTLSRTFPPPDPPADFSAVAADGSFIPPDRHSPLLYYVVNTGYAILSYGSHPDALLDSKGRLYFEDADLYISPDGKWIPIEGTRLGIKRAVEELGTLLDVARLAVPPMVALGDGSLILWNLQSEEAEVQRTFLRQFREYLDEFRAAKVPVASYISRPGSHDVVNALRIWLCECDPSDCAACSLPPDERALCTFLGTTWDRQLFEGMLAPGERSDVFESASAILERYGDHRIQFFYLNVGGEVVRIEAPQWVMQDVGAHGRAPLDLVHALVYDQCRRSPDYPPYPPALQEAHEQAVITTAERRLVERLVERALAERGIVYARSAKDRSKRRRGV